MKDADLRSATSRPATTILFRALDAVHDGVLVLALDGSIEYANKAAVELLGTDQSVVGRHVTKVLQLSYDGDSRVFELPLIAALDAKSPIVPVHSLTLTTATGSTLPVELRIEPVEEEAQVRALLLTIRSIKTRREIERQIVYQASLLDNVQETVIACDINGRILYWNRAATSMYGWQAEEVIGKRIFDVVTPEPSRDEAWKQFLRWRTEEGTRRVSESKEVRRDGTTFLASVTLSPLTNLSGERIGFVGLTRDLTHERRAQDELNRSLSLLQATLQSTADGILVVDLEGKITAWNERFASMWRIDEKILRSGEDDRALEAAISQLVDPEGFIARVRELYAAPEEESHDLIECVDGRVFERTSRPQRLNGRAIGRVWSFRDVTEHRRAAQALHEQTELYESLHRAQSDMGEGMAILTPSAMLYVNDAIQHITGYSREELLSLGSFLNVVAPDERERIQRQFAARLRGESVPNHYETSILHKNGRRIDLEVAVKQHGGPESMQIVVLLRDITGRKEIERSLISSESKFRTVVQNLGEGVLITDPKDRVLYINHRFAEILGWQLHECVGKIGYEIFIPDSHREFLEGKLRERLQGRSDQFEIQAVRRDGSLVWCSVNAVPYYDSDGTIIGTVAAITDIDERRHQDEILRRSEERFRYMTLATNDAVYDWQLTTNEIWWNDAFTKLFGYDPSQMDINFDLWTSCLHPDDRDRVLNSIDAAIRSGNQVWSDEYRFCRSDGTYATIIDRGYLVYEAGVPVRMIGAMMDITDRRRAVEELQKAVANTSAIIENTTDAILSVDRDLRIVTYNTSFQQTFLEHNGVEIYPGLSLLDFFKEEERLYWTHTFARAMEGEHFTIQRSRVLSGEVRTYEMSFNPIRDEQGIAGVALFDKDITARKQAEEALQRSRANLEALIENSSDQIWSIDVNYRLITFNTPFAINFSRLFDHQPYEGLELKPIIAQRDQGWWKPRYARALRGERFSEEYASERGGSTRYFEVSFYPIVGFSAVTGVSVFSRDVTERKKMEHQLIAAKENAEEMNRLKSSFLANMSHEIRTPMTAILGFASIIKELSPSEELNSYASTIERSGSRLLETINGILDLAKIEANRVELHPEPTDLGSEVHKTMQLFQPLANSKRLHLDFICHDNPTVFTDPQYFGQILTNLIGNAIKFTMAGSVTVTAGLTPGTEGIGEFYVQVEDTGVGIDPDFLPYIFDEFKQESGGYNRSFEGTGLGLTISRKLTELLGGTIAVQSTVGVGSVFTIRFPLLNPNEILGRDSIESQESPMVETASTALPKILLVEDTADTAEMIRLFLRGVCEIEVAQTAAEALSKTASDRYDLVLMDVNLGSGPSGLDVTRELRLREPYAATPIIALTAYAMKGDKEIALQAGCTDYLSKPFSKSELRSKIERVL